MSIEAFMIMRLEPAGRNPLHPSREQAVAALKAAYPQLKPGSDKGELWYDAKERKGARHAVAGTEGQANAFH